MTKSTQNRPNRPGQTVVRQKALIAAIRAAIAGGVFVQPAMAAEHSPLPVPVQAMDHLGRLGNVNAALNAAGNKMTINQLTNKAIIDWKSFDIDHGYAVQFKQPNAASVALNNIGNTGSPSQIFGSLSANGQIYLVNQNGFVFGKGSQVNASALVATSLGISDDAFKRGITKVFDQTKNAALKGDSEVFIKDEAGNYVLDKNHQKIPIRIFVQDGATITGAKDAKGAVEAGNRVILAAPVVDNEGTIKTPEGQTILAAAQDKVYLQEANGDPNLRGLLVEVGTGGTVENVGKVLADRGNASLIGFAVNQNGLVSATSSVSLNGSVRLLAREGLATTEGKKGPVIIGASNVRGDGSKPEDHATVKLGVNSVTQVLPDADKSATAVDAQDQPLSKIEIDGHRVYARSGAVVRATSGEIDITARNLQQGGSPDDSRVYLEKGSVVDASGLRNVRLEMDRNVLEVELRKNELRDSPLQRDGILYAKTVKVDLRDVDKNGKIPIADVSGAVNRIRRNIDERSTEGGTVNLKADGDTIVKSGATVDVSGGSVAYRPGTITTTRLTADGKSYDIAKADPRLSYTGITRQQRFEQGYVEGKAGGSLNISGNAVLVDGSLKGSTVRGPHQRGGYDEGFKGNPDNQARGSELSLRSANDIVVDHLKAATAMTEADPFPTAGGRAAPLVMDDEALNGSGFRNVKLTTDGAVTVSRGSRLDLPVTGNLTLQANAVDVEGTIRASAGSVTVKPNAFRGGFHLGRDANIDVRGLWVNDKLATGDSGAPLALNGGKVAIATRNAGLVLEQGSRILADGGARLDANGKLTAGKGGDISLTAQGDLNGGPQDLILNGDVSSYGLAQGGSLSLRSAEVVIGNQRDAVVTHTPHPLFLSPEFFRNGGFGKFDVGSNWHGLTVASGTQVLPSMLNRILTVDAATTPSADNIADLSAVGSLPDVIRKPVDLALSALQPALTLMDRVLTVGEGAKIKTEPGGSVTLNTDTSIHMNGRIQTQGGDIALNVNPVDRNGYFASQGIWLGAGSSLDASGGYKPAPSDLGLRQGEVLDGGDISLTAARGYIVAEQGSRIESDGSSAVLDLPVALGSSKTAPRTIDSNGGKVSLTAAEGMLLDGSLSAQGGGRKGAGGELAVSLNHSLRVKSAANNRPGGGEPFPDDDPDNTQEPSTRPLPRVINLTGASATSTLPTLQQGDDIPEELYGSAWLSAPQISSGGFASVKFQSNQTAGNDVKVGEIRFHGDVNLFAERRIVLDAPQLGWVADGSQDQGQVALQAAYVALGSSLNRAGPAATAGNGRIDVTAKGIELIGGLSTQGVGKLGLNSSGDLRMRGIRALVTDKEYLGGLRLAGDLKLRADQLYPATLTHYTIDAGEGGVTIEGTAEARAPVYSAGGSLTVKAGEIHQNGVLKAPFGQLNLQSTGLLELGKGSITSVSGVGRNVPFGQVQGGIDWIFPLEADGSRLLVFDKLPAKSITLKGEQVELDQGSKVNLNGGGNLTAYEWIKGPGGSVDVLDPNSAGYQQKFAIMPGYNSLMTPYDPSEFNGSGLQVGDRVYLAGGSALPAGWYTLLPAHYALLPGAYLVTPQANTTDIAPGQSFGIPEGATVVAGRYGAAGTDIADARWNGFAVEPGSAAKSRAEYDVFQANQFFADKAGRSGVSIPNLPRDAGDLTLSAAASLSLAGDVQTLAYGNGVGGHLDIEADRLAVVANAGQNRDGVVSLLASDLSGLDVSSILLGGQRSREIGGSRLTVGASTVTVAAGAHLKNGEVILAATDRVSVESGAVVESSGSGGSSEALTVTNAAGGSDGALLRVSSAGQAAVTRDLGVTGNGGVLDIAQGAQLKSAGSILLDSTKDTLLAGDLAMNGGALALHAAEISLGEVPAGASGLVLDNGQLAKLRVNELELTSRNNLNLFGGVNLRAISPAAGASSLTIDAAAIKGHGVGSSSLAADRVVLANGGAVGDEGVADGTGSLELRATRELVLGSGNYEIKGFDRVTLHSDGAIKGLGRRADGTLADSGNLTVRGDLDLAAAAFTGGHGATTRIDAAGHDITLAKLDGKSGDAGYGVSWTLDADAIHGTGNFLLPSGILQLRARQGDVSLEQGTVVDVSGRAVQLGPRVTRYSDAGSIVLQADRGNVSLAEGASLQLDGLDNLEKNSASSGDAGRLSLLASQGRVDWNGTVTAHAVSTSTQGSLRVDARDFGGFTALNGKSQNAGFSESVDLRQRAGNLTVAGSETIRAHHVGLATDQGSVTVAGTIDASGHDGGSVAISGRNGITLAATGSIEAKATAVGGAGGSVKLDTVHGDDAGSGVLDLAAASSSGKGIDVSPGSGGKAGEVHLRTGRDAGGSVALRDGKVNTRIAGVDQVALEATRVYASDGNIGTEDIQGWKDDTEAFMKSAPAISSASAPVTLMPGLEVRSAGDLDLTADWDLVSWRYGQNGTPGVLTLKAAGDLDVSKSLSDGFAPGSVGSTATQVENLLQPGDSWSYNLVAGNNVNLLPNIQVRTGTGDISVEAGGDVTFLAEQESGDRAAVIYTMGRPAEGGADADYASRRYGNLIDQTAAGSFNAEYPIDGGDIVIRAGGDVTRAVNPESPPVQQLITDWLVRAGSWSADAAKVATMWGIDVGNGGTRSFHQDVGALGGGNVTVSAGGDVRDLSVVIPTTDKPVGKTTVSGTGARVTQTFETNDYLEQGGGNLAVTAGKDILGGFYYAEKGTGSLTAGGSIGTGYLGAAAKTNPDGTPGYDDTGMGPVLALGGSQFKLSARRDLTLAAAFNPGLLAQDEIPSLNGGKQSFAITYGPDSSVDLRATAGNVVLQNDFERLAQAAGRSDVDNDKLAMSIYPGTLKAVALQGDVEIQQSVNMMPANQGQLALLAGGNLRLGTAAGSTAVVNMSDTAPSLLPSLEQPTDLLLSLTGLQGRFEVGSGDVNLLHAAIPVHQANPADPATQLDREPVRLVAATGNVDFLGGNSILYLPKAADIYAGQDIVNLDLRSQNLAKSDVTRIEAGRDIVYPTSRREDTGTLNNQGQTIELGGPGELQVLAGRNIDLGASEGVRTLGGLLNSAFGDLPGANVSVLAGFKLKTGGLDDFIKAYIESGKYGITVPGDDGQSVQMNGQEAVDYLAGLTDKRKQLKPLLDIMYREVAKAANAAARSGRKEDYQPGYDAIAALFDTQAAKGDIKMFFSQIKTAAGGDINLAAPGGLVNAGLAGTVAGSKKADQLGVVVARDGKLNAVTDGNFLVNESRVFTMGGGDILIWSSHGDIDAGRGAKSAISAPSPTTSIDANGNVKIDFPPAVSGSGIQAIASGGGKAGKVILAAPAGVVNAGEAGIVGGQVVIAATAVIGASNIQSTSGPSIGVPTAVAPPVVPAGADSAATSATKSATSMDPGGDQKTADATERARQASVAILSADVVGYGSCTTSEVREGKEDCGSGG